MPRCFIIMPISTPDAWLDKYGGDRDHFKHVLDHLIAPAVSKASLEPVPPIAKGADVIHGEIIRNIETADIVLCDMSTLNPNVFFELGVRTSVNKAVSLIKDDVTTHIPFDASIINHHTYLGSLAPWTLEKEIAELSEHLRASEANSAGANTLWKYFSLSMRAEPVKEKGGVEGKLEYLTLQIDALRKKLDSSMPVLSRGPSPHELMFQELARIAKSYGAIVESASIAQKAVAIKFKKGTLSDKARGAIENHAESAGYELTCSE